MLPDDRHLLPAALRQEFCTAVGDDKVFLVDQYVLSAISPHITNTRFKRENHTWLEDGEVFGMDGWRLGHRKTKTVAHATNI